RGITWGPGQITNADRPDLQLGYRVLDDQLGRRISTDPPPPPSLPGTGTRSGSGVLSGPGPARGADRPSPPGSLRGDGLSESTQSDLRHVRGVRCAGRLAGQAAI